LSQLFIEVVIKSRLNLKTATTKLRLDNNIIIMIHNIYLLHFTIAGLGNKKETK